MFNKKTMRNQVIIKKYARKDYYKMTFNPSYFTYLYLKKVFYSCKIFKIIKLFWNRKKGLKKCVKLRKLNFLLLIFNKK